MGDMYVYNALMAAFRRLVTDASLVHDFQGSVDNPAMNATLRHQDLDPEHLNQAQNKVLKYREGNMAFDQRRAFLPAIVSTSRGIHGELLRLLYIIADKKSTIFLIS